MDKKVFNLIKTLRQDTQSSLKMCQEAVIEAQKIKEKDDEIYNEAYNQLMKAKVIISNKKQNKEVNHFVVISNFRNIVDSKPEWAFHNLSKENLVNPILLKFGCETEQTKNELIKKHYKTLVKIGLLYSKFKPNTLFLLKYIMFDKKKTINRVLKELSGHYSEKIILMEGDFIDSSIKIDNLYNYTYMHHDHSIGVSLNYCSKEHNENIIDLVKKITHQIIFNKPLCLKENELSRTLVTYQKNSIEKELKDEKNSKILKFKTEGLLKKFKQEAVLELQKFMFAEDKADKNKTIQQLLKEKDITLLDFILV